MNAGDLVTYPAVLSDAEWTAVEPSIREDLQALRQGVEKMYLADPAKAAPKVPQPAGGGEGGSSGSLGT